MRGLLSFCVVLPRQVTGSARLSSPDVLVLGMLHRSVIKVLCLL